MTTRYVEEIEYTRGDHIGSGAFGEVYKALEKNSKNIYALKDIKCSKNDDLDSAVTEIGQLGVLSHPNIVALFNVKVKETKAFEAIISLLLEYCSGGDLNQRLRSSSSKTLNLQWMSEIINAIDYLHSRDIIHRDLKPQNILLTADDHVKMADFGLAERFTRKSDQQTWLCYYFEHGVGAACYVAPELIKEPIHYNYKVDIFAIGVVFYAIMERTFLTVKDDRCYGIFVDNGKREKQPLGIHMSNIEKDVNIRFRGRNTTITKIVKRTLKYDYKLRPNAQEIKLVVERYRSSLCVLL